MYVNAGERDECTMAKKYYAVKNGNGGVSGIYTSWPECKAQVDGVSGVRYKGFQTLEEAEAFLRGENSAKTAESMKAPSSNVSKDVIPNKEGVAIAYVDGSYNKSTKEYSCGAVLFYQGKRMDFSEKFSDPELAEMHNVAGEIMGAETVIKYCIENSIPEVEIYHDYRGVAQWAIGGWKANKRGTQDYAEFCRKAAAYLKFSFVEVRGHSGDTWNDEADRLAKAALGLE